jgi:TolB protein
MSQVRSRKVVALAALAGAVLATRAARADDHGGGVIIDVSGAKRGAYPIAVPVGVDSDPAAAKEVAEVASFDLGIAGLFKVLAPKSFLADLGAEKLGIDPPRWKDVGAYGVIKYKVTVSGGEVQLDARLYEVSKGDIPKLTLTYRGKRTQLRRLTHQFCNEIVKYYTGELGFFGSQIVFTARGQRGRSTVMAMDFDGHGAYALSHNSSINILPAMSRSGGKVAFTSYMRANPDLYVVGAGGGRPHRVSKWRGMNTGASWSPDGSRIALTLSKDGNPDIYVIDAATGAIIKRLTNDRAIDTSPAWSPDGSQIAFVSDREGGPQIFVMSASGGGAHRVSMNGSYNTTPAWSPKKGARVLAYTTRDGGTYDIVTVDLANKTMVRITQGEGRNQDPSFSPDGRAIAFSSQRAGGSGVYVGNADGTGTATRVWAGAATDVDWGPAP